MGKMLLSFPFLMWEADLHINFHYVKKSIGTIAIADKCCKKIPPRKNNRQNIFRILYKSPKTAENIIVNISNI